MAHIMDLVLSPIIPNKAHRDQIMPYILSEVDKIRNKIYTADGTILQIFIPRKIVDQVVYLSRERGHYWNVHIPVTFLDAYWNAVKDRYSDFSNTWNL